MGKSVYVSPSTQEKNLGAGNYGTEEQEMNKIADVVINELARHGVATYRNDPGMTLAQVVADSNSLEPTVHFAIHSNAGGGRGCEVYCWRFGSSGHALAQSIYNNLSGITPTSDRGVHEGYNFYGQGKHMYEVAYTDAPAVLVEIDFHDSIEGANWIMNNIEKIGVLFAKCLLIYLNVKYLEPIPPNPPEPTYRKNYEEIIKEVSPWAKVYLGDLDIINKPGHNWAGLIEKLYYTIPT